MPQARALFEILLREHSPALRSYLHAVLKDAAAVDDIFQETCLIAWRRLDDFDRSRPFGPWLRGIARHLVLAFYRRRAKAVDPRLLTGVDERLCAIESQPGDTFDERLAGLRACIEELEPEAARVIHLHYWEKLGTRELAEAIGVSLEAAKKRLQRARSRLLVCMRRSYPLGGTA